MSSDITAKFTYHRIGVGGVCIKDNKILLVKHKYGPSKGKWIIPGGFLDLGEPLSHAIEREFFEETSVGVQVQKLLGIRHLTRDRKSGGLVSDLYIIFLVKYISGIPKATDSLEITAAKFISLEEISKLKIADISKFILDEFLTKKGFKLLSYHPQPDLQSKLKIHSYEFFG